MLKIVAKAKEASLKKRKFDEDCSKETEKDNSIQSKGKGILNFVTKGKGDKTQVAINRMMKKDLKEKVDYQCGLFFYTSVLPFNVVKNPEFEKFCEMVGRYGIGYKPPSYHDMRKKLLKKAVANIDVTL
ncbi:hypothetical protein Cni_G09452 [Canna indica]|uniref:Uncharacterized protein n=1 Tax=Canna indica TaxID=4628 RepID=A0AAQ3K415_9LILI|nr:hypothetical protein Cni_G09452 [Canna indica]